LLYCINGSLVLNLSIELLLRYGVKRIAILGSTGSIGRQAVKIISRYPDDFTVVALACSSSIEVLAEQVRTLKPQVVCLGDAAMSAGFMEIAGDVTGELEITHSEEGLGLVASHPDVDCVLNGLVGFPGLYPSLMALSAGKRLCLANKESLVMAGEYLMALAKEGGGEIIPVDSEHSAIFQCLKAIGEKASMGVRRIILTASGGPFLQRPIDTFDSITIAETLNHPTWKMGPKITVDSATLFNKGFEIIEAKFLFNMPAERIETVIHPQSIVHSLVEFEDGSMLAQMSYPTMEIPIQYALTYPERKPTDVTPLDLTAISTLNFETPDLERFPALSLARRALKMGGTAPAALNLANDEAVRLFLEGRLPFSGIAETVKKVLDEVDVLADYDYDDIISLKDRVSRLISDEGPV